jgi:hypothetical protein
LGASVVGLSSMVFVIRLMEFLLEKIGKPSVITLLLLSEEA